MTYEEFEHSLASVASVVKLTCGVGNNAAHLIMLDAHDQIRKHPNYRHEVKRLYKQAIALFRQQERGLLHAATNRFFHVDDMPLEIRKKYGDITDAQYFEFWQGLGARAYTESRPLLTSLHNKYRLSLLNHGIEYSELLAWPMVAQACLELACKLYDTTLKQCTEQLKIPRNIMQRLFALFNLRPVADIWYKALMLIEPKVAKYNLTTQEERNIELGLQQLGEKWSDPNLLYGAAITATEDFAEVFRTKGENKKALREITEIMRETDEELQKNNEQPH